MAERQLQLAYVPSTFGGDHLKTGVEILACTMQLMSIEVSVIGTDLREFSGISATASADSMETGAEASNTVTPLVSSPSTRLQIWILSSPLYLE